MGCMRQRGVMEKGTRRYDPDSFLLLTTDLLLSFRSHLEDRLDFAAITDDLRPAGQRGCALPSTHGPEGASGGAEEGNSRGRAPRPDRFQDPGGREEIWLRHLYPACREAASRSPPPQPAVPGCFPVPN